jgi:hypothetical protein
MAPFSNRKERTGFSKSWSFRFGLLGNRLLPHGLLFTKRVRSPPAPILPPAGLENFQSGAAFFQNQEDWLQETAMSPGSNPLMILLTL